MRKVRSAFFIWTACADLFAAQRDFLFPYVCEFFSWLTSCVVHRGTRASRKRLSVFGVAMNRDRPNLLLNPHGTPAAMHGVAR
jgi:hypothetical protein